MDLTGSDGVRVRWGPGPMGTGRVGAHKAGGHGGECDETRLDVHESRGWGGSEPRAQSLGTQDSQNSGLGAWGLRA
ncbi:hypothetical protein GCM10022224_000810 [Nonomuraea antimicrobica]|uniref:Uncharacterized protein n=1 Tax=Nonomuraea antimicrobica TaxID=561173 RepID=A0ABP7AXN4_9ACTN